MPRVVPREQLKAAMALEWLRGDVGMIAGPALAGVLIAAFGVHGDLRHRPRDLPGLARLPRPHARAARRRRTPTAPSLRSIARACATRAAARSCWAPTWSTSTRCSSACRRRSSRPSPRARRRRGARAAVRRAGGRLAARRAVQRLDKRVHRHGRAVALAAGGWGLAIVGFGLAARCGWRSWPGGRRRDGHGLGHLPQRDLEPDHPRPPARPAGRHRDDLLHLGADPGQLRGGRASPRWSACARRSSRAA